MSTNPTDPKDPPPKSPPPPPPRLPASSPSSSLSSSTIPNLLSLRGARGRGTRGRERGNGSGRGGSLTPVSGRSHDQTIQDTDDDAASSRLSAVNLGYLDDPFAQYFVDRSLGPPPRRLPIINRGTYTRTCALDRLVDSFLSVEEPADDGALAPQTVQSTKQRQVVSLGAGTDTRIFRLFRGSACSGLVYHEVDFPITVAKKARTVQANPALRHILGNPVFEDSESWSSQPPRGGEYYCHALDLRHHQQLGSSPTALRGFRTDLPTLLVSECCLCYLEPRVSQNVIKWFGDTLPNLASIIYEPVKPHDSFGRMMVSNLAARRIHMPTLESYPQPSDQERRLRDAGLRHTKALTVESIWQTWVSSEEKERVDSLEGLDEVEEWQLLADHYVVAWGWRGEGFSLWDGEGREAESQQWV